ncbi:hypothetical protein ACFY15_27625 [Streptomyces sp. NPDC001373]|uniref:hypothetical protein n=1 Tax=Streptomyces sp. NPDC001373 TaxID=3364565 RepID=UPI0036BDD205
MAEASYAKLLWLEAKRIQDPDGADEIQISRGDGGIFERIQMRQGDVYEFNERLIPFDGTPQIDIILREVNEATHQASVIGGAGINPSEIGLGERTQSIGAPSSSLYELWYKVI